MATEKQIYHFTAEVKDVEIRKVEDIDASFENGKGEMVESHYIKLTCDVGEDMEEILEHFHELNKKLEELMLEWERLGQLLEG